MKKILTEVPEHILVKPDVIKKGQRWSSDYNIAAWFRFTELKNQTIKLFVIWTDSEGEHSVLVDYTVINSSTILMSGIAHLELKGNIKNMFVAVGTESEAYIVDELFVQATRSTLKLKMA